MKYAGLGFINSTSTFSFNKAHFPSINPTILYTGLYLVTLGVGGIKASFHVQGGEKFDENDVKEKKLRSNFFDWFLFSMYVYFLSMFNDMVKNTTSFPLFIKSDTHKIPTPIHRETLKVLQL
ncbi:hypothetical protein SUGI_1427180 [Cryptomeria japonica]|uniref:Uncharacterized protein n=1 Tax=Cryptomeria japonica TaxID=3369 RepID=A0AAD3RQZ4_CRYJA|nr:hypothetical protein SUGI_1427180 [Cryptomeria japonica]